MNLPKPRYLKALFVTPLAVVPAAILLVLYSFVVGDLSQSQFSEPRSLITLVFAVLFGVVVAFVAMLCALPILKILKVKHWFNFVTVTLVGIVPIALGFVIISSSPMEPFLSFAYFSVFVSTTAWQTLK